MASSSSILLPGDPLPLDPNSKSGFPNLTHQPGRGTHLQESTIRASLVGTHSTTTRSPQRQQDSSTSSTIVQDPTTTLTHTITHTNHLRRHHPHRLAAALLPSIGSFVLCRITKVQARQVSASIICVYADATTSPTKTLTPIPLPHALPSLIRREDIRATGKDSVQTRTSFGVGDIVRAAVISLGDNQGGYYLSTGEDALGVVVGWGRDGGLLAPVSWKEMVGAGGKEARKVGRPGWEV